MTRGPRLVRGAVLLCSVAVAVAAVVTGCTAAAEPTAERTVEASVEPSGDSTTARRPSPTVTLLEPGELRPLAPGTYALSVLPSEPNELPRPAIEVTSDDFSGDGVFVMAGGESAFRVIGVTVIAEVAGNPCDRTSGPFMDPGPTVADLAAALAAQPLTDVTDPVPVSIDGHDGLYLELSIPDDIDVRACDDDVYSNFLLEDDIRTDGSPGTASRMWILDVDRHRLVVNASYDPGTTAEQIDELTRMVESMSFSDIPAS